MLVRTEELNGRGREAMRRTKLPAGAVSKPGGRLGGEAYETEEFDSHGVWTGSRSGVGARVGADHGAGTAGDGACGGSRTGPAGARETLDPDDGLISRPPICSAAFRSIRAERSRSRTWTSGFLIGSGVSANVGNWDSIHSTSSPADHWYESDYYASVTFTAGKVKPGLLYTSYTSPADSFATVKELAGVVAIDDSASSFPLSPKVILAFELGDGQADGGADKGTYLELGIRPTVKLAPKATLAIPVKLGLSANHYYEGPTGDNTFGFFDLGAQLSVPVVSGKGGALEVHGGVDLYRLGDNMKLLNDGDAFKPVGTVGLTFTY